MRWFFPRMIARVFPKEDEYSSMCCCLNRILSRGLAKSGREESWVKVSFFSFQQRRMLAFNL